MIIPEFLSLGGGTGTRSKISSLIYLPFSFFFLWFHSLLSSHSHLSIFRPSFYQGVGMALRGEGALDKGRGKGMRIPEFLSPGGGGGGGVQF